MTSHVGLCLHPRAMCNYGTACLSARIRKDDRSKCCLSTEIIPQWLLDWFLLTGYAVSIPCGYSQAVRTAGQDFDERIPQPNL